ncbi:MAG: 1,4-dihydroxy-6-naphthoate synthase [Bacteroidetes bacterium]|nr:MAG: 1,4-dihydroxy-6-naphthoate synthase [Bacteroidota bacterium]
MSVKLTIGFSSCPNDCFIFDALIHRKIDTGGIEFVAVIEDVESLNKRALRGELDITKLSYHAYLYCKENYVYLNSGSALGFGCGPLLITHSKEIAKNFDDINFRKDMSVLVPGELTTAHYLLKKFFPEIGCKTHVVFSDIEKLLLEKKYDAGVIIHENRFTYEEKGLQKIVDLGELWEKTTGLPIPLGGIMAKRSLGQEMINKIDILVRQSVEYAFEHPEEVMVFVKQNAQEMSEEVMKQHIALYVNSYSIDLGEEGRGAVEVFLNGQ